MSGDGNSITMFTELTGASTETAAKYVNMSRGSVDEAIARYYDDLESGNSHGDDGQHAPSVPNVPNVGAPQNDLGSTVDDIMGSLKDSSDKGGEKGGKGEGKSQRKGEGKESRKILIVFFADGFMVDEEPDLAEEEPAPEQPVASVPRRTGMMGLNDLKKQTKGNKKMPKIPKLKPLRSYDTEENKQFLALVKGNRCPRELQKRDEVTGEPIPVSIMIDDERPKTYEEISKELKKAERQRDQEESEAHNEGVQPKSNLFAGTGFTLSSAPATGSSATSASVGSGGNRSAEGAAPALVALIAAAPVPEVDESKPHTTIQLRLASGARVRARLNTHHKVADLWRHVAAQMGVEAFKAASQHELSAGFPPKALTDPNVTIESADLANAAVTHRCR